MAAPVIRRTIRPPKQASLLSAGVVVHHQPQPGLVVTVPLKVLNTANTREHWAARQGRWTVQRTGVRTLVGLYLRQLLAANFPAPSGPIQVTMTRVGPGTLDVGANLEHALKPIQDGVADALADLGLIGGETKQIRTKAHGLVPRFYGCDNDPRLAWQPSQQERRKEWGVRVRLDWMTP